MDVYQSILDFKKTNQKGLAVLIDPDNLPNKEDFDQLMVQINEHNVDYIFVGGSLTIKNNFESTITYIQSKTSIPVVIFPGSIDQLSPKADALLFLSLISGRNPELLIGNHVITAPKIKAMELEAISTGYILISCGKMTTANYMSNTFPIPNNKPEIAAATAMAGEMLGMKCIYLDGGSGADQPINSQIINTVKKHTNLPLIVGGGIRNGKQARESWQAGADIVVIGTAFEKKPELLHEINKSKKSRLVK